MRALRSRGGLRSLSRTERRRAPTSYGSPSELAALAKLPRVVASADASRSPAGPSPWQRRTTPQARIHSLHRLLKGGDTRGLAAGARRRRMISLRAVQRQSEIAG